MNEIIYHDKDIKKKLNKLLSKYSFLDAIINNLIDEYKVINILNVVDNDKGFEIEVDIDEFVITINSNFINGKTFLLSKAWDYMVVYSNVFKNDYAPLGIQYIGEDKAILKVVTNDNSRHKYVLRLYKENTIEYEINIYQENNNINDRFIIDNLLSEKTIIARIKDLLDIINQLIDLLGCQLKIECKDDKGSSVIVDHGILTKYVEYYMENNMEIKIYLEQGKFYKSETTTKEIENKYISYVKKKGSYNG